MSTSGCYATLNSFYEHSNNYYEKFNDMLNLMSIGSIAPILRSITSCLVLGPGSGEQEIAVIKRLMPNVRTLTAIEPDEESVRMLLLNVNRHLPNVRCTVRQMSIHKYIENLHDGANDQLFDAVLAFQVSFRLNPAERSLLFTELLGNHLLPGSFVFVLQACQLDRPDSPTRLLNYLTHTDQGTNRKWVSTEEEFIEKGFRTVDRRELEFQHDFGTVDQRLANLLALCTGCTVTVEELDAAVRHVLPSTVANSFAELIVFQK